ncbi:hypothetical protein [Dickeya lacustris]|uniref:Capsular polysaccharide biosynthesis protein n=1 Tax=Dickeya lacustris TaxID=2259638 RepID=A0ABY8GBP1_9GAMM|nr:hypothetical protein [Dickeya lacustris]WFN57387.1 hypothetical protein O1Q98_09460 [Dickeya lacustris]
MTNPQEKIFIIFDDRELVSGEVKSIVGRRHYGEITFKRRQLFSHLKDALPEWAQKRLLFLRNSEDLPAIKSKIIAKADNASVCVIAGRAGFINLDRLVQLIERLPYAEENFTDRLYKPLLVFMKNTHELINRWSDFCDSPLHLWDQVWQDTQRVQSVEPLDLAKIRDFLSFTSGSTATRHFNEIKGDAYYYTKCSADKKKMLAEYSFYNLVPEAMRPWLIQTFGYEETTDQASYKMMRYYLADAALQWVHGAFDFDTFVPFAERLLFFIAERPQKACSVEQSAKDANTLFVKKLNERIDALLEMKEGQRINNLMISTSEDLDIRALRDRYLKLYQQHEKAFAFNYQVVGHGDPCFSNVLYDQQRYLMKLIDPKGAVTEEGLWTHPLYDLSKVSHSVMGDYDFINNGLYNVGFSDDNRMQLNIKHTNHEKLKSEFIRQVIAMGHDPKIMRLGEASLFLSMLPLHIDYPNKVVAFILTAKHILDEIEGSYV